MIARSSTNRVLRSGKKYRHLTRYILLTRGTGGSLLKCRRRYASCGSMDSGAMGEVVNLRKVRKQAKKREDAERAAANRLVHGRSKTERDLEANRTAKLNRHLDGHRIDTGDA